MNTAKLEVSTVCEEVLGKELTGINSRTELESNEHSKQIYAECFKSQKNGNYATMYTTAFLKIYKAIMILTVYENQNGKSTNVYFTDDAFPQAMISEIVDTYFPGYRYRLVYEQVKTPYDTTHVQKKEGCDIWCIDFDGTITTYENSTAEKYEYVRELTRIVTKPQDHIPRSDLPDHLLEEWLSSID